MLELTHLLTEIAYFHIGITNTYVSTKYLCKELEKLSNTHLPLTENRLKFFVPSNPTNNYENIYIW